MKIEKSDTCPKCGNWTDEFIEGGLTCIILSLYSTYNEFLNFEKRKESNEKRTSN